MTSPQVVDVMVRKQGGSIARKKDLDWCMFITVEIADKY